MITMNNRSLTALSKANMKPSKLVNITGNAIEEAKLTQRLDEMGGKPSESIFIRKIKEVVNIPPIYDEDIIGFVYNGVNAQIEYYYENSKVKLSFSCVYLFDFCNFDYINK